ncbi:MAG: nicotinamide riboside transporter PnuC [Bacteroidota bacterium]
MSSLEVIEIAATGTSLGYLVLLIRQNKWCWPLAIVSGLLSIYLFFQSKLYSESFLYGYYVLISIYGWWNWSKPKKELLISTWKFYFHVVGISTCLLLSATLGYFFATQTDAARPYLDASTTIFSFLASILETRKILSGWIYWIVINGVTVALYSSKSLDIYAGLMVIYFIMSIVGYITWKKSYTAQTESSQNGHPA